MMSKIYHWRKKTASSSSNKGESCTVFSSHVQYVCFHHSSVNSDATWTSQADQDAVSERLAFVDRAIPLSSRFNFTPSRGRLQPFSDTHFSLLIQFLVPLLAGNPQEHIERTLQQKNSPAEIFHSVVFVHTLPSYISAAK